MRGSCLRRNDGRFTLTRRADARRPLPSRERDKERDATAITDHVDSHLDETIEG